MKRNLFTLLLLPLLAGTLVSQQAPRTYSIDNIEEWAPAEMIEDYRERTGTPTDLTGDSSPAEEADSLALVALYNATDGPNWTQSTNWLTGPVSDWFGVTAADGRVLEIDLSNNGLSGEIPDVLGDLTALQELWLRQNELTGPIPTELGNLVELTAFFLERNNLTGTIPASLGNLTKLGDLWLNGNELEGPIPSQIWNLNNLFVLSLAYNNLEGSIPPEIGNFGNLFLLWLAGNQLSGQLPPELGDAGGFAPIFDMHTNGFTGNIPPEVANAAPIEGLYLNRTQLSGAVDINVLKAGFTLSGTFGCNLTETDLCIPDTPEYRDLGANPICGLPLDPTCSGISLPIELVAFTAVVEDARVRLSWTTSSEIDNAGFSIEHRLLGVDGWHELDFVEGAGTTSTERSYEFLSPEMVSGQHRFRLRQIDFDGQTTLSEEVEVVIEGKPGTLNDHVFPNPFRDVATLTFSVPLEQDVTVAVFDAMGRRMQEVRPGRLSASQRHQISIGSESWPSGLYFYRITGESVEASGSVVIVGQ